MEDFALTVMSAPSRTADLENKAGNDYERNIFRINECFKRGVSCSTLYKTFAGGKSEKWVDRHPEISSDEADICRENYLP